MVFWNRQVRKDSEMFVEWIKENIVPIAIGFVSVLVISILIFLGVHTTDVSGTISSKNWERKIYIDKYDWVHHTKESSTVPDGAINVDRWTEAERYNTTDANGKTVRRTRYVKHVSYDIQEWTYSRELDSSGIYPDVPFWPDYSLSVNPVEREGNKTENYTIVFIIKGKEKKYHPKFDEYTRLTESKTYTCKVNGFGFVVNLAK